MLKIIRYFELVRTDGAEALRYLKTELAECVDHENKEQSEEVSYFNMFVWADLIFIILSN